MPVASATANLFWALGVLGIFPFIWILVVEIVKRRERRADKKADDADDRKAQFLKFLRRWEGEAASDLGHFNPNVAETLSDRRLTLIEHETEMLRDYKGAIAAEFSVKVKTVADMTGGDVSSPELNENGNLKGVQKLIDAIQSLTKFVEQN